MTTMHNRTLMFKVLYTSSTLAGTLLVGLPAYAQISGAGNVLPSANSPPVISAPGASPAYIANSAIAPDFTNATAFAAWVTGSAPVQVSTAPIPPRPEGESLFIVYRFFVTDADGYSDIRDAQVQLLNPNNSVHTAFAAAKPLGHSSAITNEYYAQFEMLSTDLPATGLSYYKIAIKVADAAIQSAHMDYIDTVAAPKLFQYGQLLLLKANLAAIDFGALQVNAKSVGVPVTLTNLGNVPVDNTLHASDLVKGGSTIPATKIWYGPTSSATGTEFPSSGANAKRDAGFNLAPGASRIVYLAVDVPAGTAAGTYTTTLTFTGAQHTGDACGADCATVTWS
jgi:hypothetical protein